MRTSHSVSHSRKQDTFFLHEERSKKGNKLHLTFSQHLSKPNVMSSNLKIDYYQMYCRDDLELIVLFSQSCGRNQ